MTTLDQEQDVVDLAKDLGLTGSPVEAIIDFCQEAIDRWVADVGGVTSVGELQELVTSRLNLAFEEITDDADFDKLKYCYARRGEFVFATLKDDFTDDTFGTMVRLKDGSLVAVIDCRGVKAARRFFTRWHEIAHVLVKMDVNGQVFRLTDEPLERLMDQIAGRVGFYDSIFNPVYKNHVPKGDLLTFQAIEAVRQSYCPYASFQSTLFACQRRLATPLLYIEARMAYSEDERRGLKQRRLFECDEPEPKLRVQLAVPNKAATDFGLTARWNMRVPESSAIHATFHGDTTDTSGKENLKTWTFSSGGYLRDCEVFVQARRLDQFVMATIQPVSRGHE